MLRMWPKLSGIHGLYVMTRGYSPDVKPAAQLMVCYFVSGKCIKGKAGCVIR